MIGTSGLNAANSCILPVYEFQGWKFRIQFDEVLDFCRAYEKVYLYGTGVYGQFCEEQLNKSGIKIMGYVISDGQKKRKGLQSHKIYYIHEVLDELKEAAVILCSDTYADEMAGFLEQHAIKNYWKLQITDKERVFTKDCKGIFQGALLRLKLTNKCPAKCRFCLQKLSHWTEDEKNLEMPSNWYYEYLKPLYPKVKMLSLTGGDPFVVPGVYEYMEFISKHYPHITIRTESNGVPFVEKFQKLAYENLFSTHFSINASNADTFIRGCWEGANGEQVFAKTLNHIKSYMELLRENKRECFAPSISMVINKDTAEDVVEFVKLGLELGVSVIHFYFDIMENNMEEDYFSYPEQLRNALDQLMEMEYILKGKFYIFYRFRTPMKELEMAQTRFDSINKTNLNSKYADLLGLAENRSVEQEFIRRNEWRKMCGKELYTIEEDLGLVLGMKFNKKWICKLPWNELNIYPDGGIVFCCTHTPSLNLYDFIEDGKVDWDRIINSNTGMALRSDMLHGNYSVCPKYCAANGEYHEIESFFEYEEIRG